MTRRVLAAVVVAGGLAVVAPAPAHALCAEVSEPAAEAVVGACVWSEPGAIRYDVYCGFGNLACAF